MFINDSKLDRLHYLDSARMILMLLGIPYHAALLFQDKFTWYAYTHEKSEILMAVAAFIHVFRMPSFFLVAGCLSAIVLQTYKPSRWLKKRFVVLGPPLLFGALIIHPIQLSYSVGKPDVSLSSITHNPIVFYKNLTAGTGIAHLWFLLSLLIISTIVAIFWKQISTFCKLRTIVNISAKPQFFVLAFFTLINALFVGFSLEMAKYFPPIDFPFHTTVMNSLVDTSLAIPSFALGMLMVLVPNIADSIMFKGAGAFICTVIAVLLFSVFSPFLSPSIAWRMISAALAVPMTGVVLSLCRDHLDRRIEIVSWFSKASFTIYLVQHPIVIALGVLTKNWSIGWPLHYLFVVGMTLLLSSIVYVVVRDIPYLSSALGAARTHRG